VDNKLLRGSNWKIYVWGWSPPNFFTLIAPMRGPVTGHRVLSFERSRLTVFPRRTYVSIGYKRRGWSYYSKANSLVLFGFIGFRTVNDWLPAIWPTLSVFGWLYNLLLINAVIIWIIYLRYRKRIATTTLF